MSIRRNVTTFFGTECQTYRRGTACGCVEHLTVEPHLLSLKDLNGCAAGPGSQFASRRLDLGRIQTLLVSRCRAKGEWPRGSRLVPHRGAVRSRWARRADPTPPREL